MPHLPCRNNWAWRYLSTIWQKRPRTLGAVLKRARFGLSEVSSELIEPLYGVTSNTVYEVAVRIDSVRTIPGALMFTGRSIE